VSVGTIGIVGTASRGPLTSPIILGGIAEARERFGAYDQWRGGGSNELTLVRALELAYAHGATHVVAVRVSGKTGGGAVGAAKASRMLQSASGECVNLRANTPGTWGNSLSVNVAAAEENPFIESEVHAGTASPI